MLEILGLVRPVAVLLGRQTLLLAMALVAAVLELLAVMLVAQHMAVPVVLVVRGDGLRLDMVVVAAVAD